MERMLRVLRVKFAGPGFSSMSPKRRKKGKEKRTAETECALASEEQKDCRLGRNAVGVLLASREVQEKMDVARREENRSKKDKTAQVITEMCKRFMVRNR